MKAGSISVAWKLAKHPFPDCLDFLPVCTKEDLPDIMRFMKPATVVSKAIEGRPRGPQTGNVEVVLLSDILAHAKSLFGRGEITSTGNHLSDPACHEVR